MPDIIDDNGRLFGYLNVIDALAVVLVISILLAGFAIITQPEPDRETRYATVEVGPQHDAIATTLEEGDALRRASDGDTAFRITDIHQMPGRNGTARPMLRLAYTLNSESAPVRAGSKHTLLGTTHRINGTVLQASASSPELNVSRTPVVVETSADTGLAASIQAGDTYQLGNDTITIIESVSVVETSDDNRLRVGAVLRTVTVAGVERFGGTPIEIGRTLSLGGPASSVPMTVRYRGNTTLPPER